MMNRIRACTVFPVQNDAHWEGLNGFKRTEPKIMMVNFCWINYTNVCMNNLLDLSVKTVLKSFKIRIFTPSYAIAYGMCMHGNK